MIRKIKKVFTGTPVMEGAGVRLRRIFGFNEAKQFDPFLLLDDFRGDDEDDYIAGFPWHPHRGIETITYILAGNVEHGDSLGNKGTIGTGDVQWMSAGSGIIHQEMPKPSSDGKNYGFQLWANLPASQKMSDPRYRDIKNSEIIEFEHNGATVKVIAGELFGNKGPVGDIAIQPLYADISLNEYSTLCIPVESGHTVFAYAIEGEGYFCREKNPFSYDISPEKYSETEPTALVENQNLVLFEDGDEIEVFTEDSNFRFLLLSGKPLNEPIAWRGPIVMNTREELQIAFEEFHNGTFIKKRG
jgi:redox-sensitive bicupin YhaK (pirin superfamily)